MKFKAFIVYGILLLLAASVLSYLIFNADIRTITYSDLENDDTVLAKVEGLLIKSSDLKKSVDISTFKPLNNKEKLSSLKKALAELTMDKILASLADRRNIIVTEDEVQKEIDNLVNMHGEENFSRLLQSQKISMTEFKEGVYEELVKRKLEESIISELKAEIVIPDSEIENFYQQNREMYNISDLAHIYIQIQPPYEQPEIEKARKTAETVISRLKSGSDFAALASKYSHDNSTKDNGGYLGAMSRGSFAVSIREEASRLEEGHFSSEPVRIQSGFIILKRLNSKYREISEVKDEIIERLIEPLLTKSYSEYLQKMEKDADVQYLYKFSD